MFQFPRFALKTLCIQVINNCFTPLLITQSVTITKYQVGCPIRRSVDQSLFSAPHGLSQSITSFIASYCQGIHQTPFSRLIWSRNSQTISRTEVVIFFEKIVHQHLSCDRHVICFAIAKTTFIFELKCNPPLAGRSRTFQRMNALSSIPSCHSRSNSLWLWLVYLTWKDCKLSLN